MERQARVNECIQQEKDWCIKCAQVQLVERSDCAPEVNAVPQNGGDEGYETVVVTLDSGAYNAACPPQVRSHFPVKPAEASQTDKRYSAANGPVIQTMGKGWHGEGAAVTMPVQVADVSKALGAAREFLDTGNRVVLDRDEQGRSCSYLDHKATGHRTAVSEKGGTFQFNVRIPKGNASAVAGSHVQEVRNVEGFPRLGTLAEDLFY